MKAHPPQPSACPLAAVDQRLTDTHRLWHQAEAAYFDPDGFRLAIQNAIQTLRSVTFIVQKHKAIIPDFKNWYGDLATKEQGEWQKRLHADALMRWLVEARNRIEKEGDLEANSFVRAEIIASYLDVGPRIEIPAKLFQSPRELLRTIPNGAAGEHVHRHGTLRLQRRWVENTLPDYELLDAIAIAFGKLTELVHDAHRQIGLSPPQTIHGDAGESYDLPAMGWRFPCMIAHDLPRTADFSLADGSQIEFEVKHTTKKVTRAKVEELLRNRGVDVPIKTAMGRKYDNYDDLICGYFEMFRSVFLKDGYHISMLFLFRDMKPIHQMQIVVENPQQKYLLMRQLAHEVTKTGADAALMIGETWMAKAENLRPYERPADSPTRKEALHALLVRKIGDPVDCVAMINRDGAAVSLTATEVITGGAAFEFAPFYTAWGRPVPPSWIETDAALMARAKTE
jgi:hypothetical protein